MGTSPEISSYNRQARKMRKTLIIILSSPREALASAGRARRAGAFDEVRRYHTRPLRLNKGPENLHFGKPQFLDLNFNAWIFLFFMPKNDQIIIPKFWTSYIRTNAREIST